MIDGGSLDDVMEREIMRVLTGDPGNKMQTAVMKIVFLCFLCACARACVPYLHIHIHARAVLCLSMLPLMHTCTG
jgi:hypothetical protein